MPRSWKETLLKEYPRLSRESKFRFSCHKGLSCFTQCCRDVNIFLTPYDVLRMKNALHLSSGEFLEKYTVPLLVADERLPVVVLKMMEDEGKTCPLVTPEGCMIYEDRPWSCRMYPLGMASPMTEAGGEEFFLMMEEDAPCLGFQEEREWIVEEWLINEGADVYDKKSQSYKEITAHKCFRQGKGLGPSKLQMFHMTCYDLDRFRRLVLESSFFNRFDVEAEAMEKIKTDDEELLDFGLKWLRFSLFGEDTIRIKGEILEEKKRELDKTRGAT